MGRVKLTYSDSLRVKLLCSEGWSQSSVARLFGVDSGNISRIVSGKAWRSKKNSYMSDKEYLVANSKRNDETGCLEWTQSFFSNGYGRAYRRGKSIGVHRLAWETFYGKIPAGLCICHKCDNRRCIDASHLFLGSQQDNIDDAIAKNRRAIGERHGMAKLTQGDADTIRSLAATDMSKSEIARMYGITRKVVYDIHIGKLWNYKKPQMTQVGK